MTERQTANLSQCVCASERAKGKHRLVSVLFQCVSVWNIDYHSEQSAVAWTNRQAQSGQRVCPLATRGPLSSNQPSPSCLAFQQDACLPQSQRMTVVNVVRLGRGNKRPAGQNKRVRPKHEYPHSMCRITSAFYRLGSKNWGELKLASSIISILLNCCKCSGHKRKI